MTDQWKTAAEPITPASIRAACAALERQYEREQKERAERAEAVNAWFDTLPAHARRHVLVIMTVQCIIGGCVMHPQTAKDIEAEIRRICKMTPQEADEDSKQQIAAVGKKLMQSEQT